MSIQIKLSVISHFYNKHEWVDRHVLHWQKLNQEAKQQIEFIIVDDHSDVEYKLPENDLNIRLFRVTDDKPWNQSGSRNLGVYHAAGKVALLIDIDQFMDTNFLERLCSAADNLQRNTLYFFKLDRPIVNVQNGEELNHHPNSFFVNLSDFKSKIHYDEDFAGHYGYEDIFLFRAWEKIGGKLTFLNESVCEDMRFGTTTLNRDIKRNFDLINKKITDENCRVSPSILRFNWKEIL